LHKILFLFDVRLLLFRRSLARFLSFTRQEGYCCPILNQSPKSSGESDFTFRSVNFKVTEQNFSGKRNKNEIPFASF
jgi:hypothetical protein